LSRAKLELERNLTDNIPIQDGGLCMDPELEDFTTDHYLFVATYDLMVSSSQFSRNSVTQNLEYGANRIHIAHRNSTSSSPMANQNGLALLGTFISEAYQLDPFWSRCRQQIWLLTTDLMGKIKGHSASAPSQVKETYQEHKIPAPAPLSFHFTLLQIGNPAHRSSTPIGILEAVSP
jgi:hypothetical protein